MIIDNGTQATLLIPGVFAGICGVQGKTLSFRPNLTKWPPEKARVGVLNDDQAISIEVHASPDNEGFYTATFEVLA